MDYTRIHPTVLEGFPTLAQGQADDLKLESKSKYSGHLRYWLTRMTKEDGQEHAVTVERLEDGKWVVIGRYGEPRSEGELCD